MTTTPLAPPRPAPGLTRGQLHAVAGCYFVASFAALGLPPYLTEILPALGDERARWAGLLYVVPTVFSALGGPLWGRLADRFGHKPLLLRAQLGLSLAFLLAGAAGSLPLFALALVLQGVLGGTYAASTGYVGAAIADRIAMARALTLMQGAARLSLVAAPIVVGALTPWLPPQRQYLVLAVLPLVAASMITTLPTPPRPAPTARIRADHTGRTWTHPVGLYALEFGFVFSTVISFPYLVVLISQTAPSTPPAVAGLLFALPHLVFLAAAMPLHGPVGDRPRAALACGLGLVAIGLTGHVLAHGLAGLVLVRLCFGVGLTLSLVALSALAADASRGRPPGALFGWIELFSKGGAVAAGVVATLTNAVWGAASPMAWGAVGALLVALATVLLTLRPRTLRLPRSTPMSNPRTLTLPTADEVVAHTLLNCLLREISGPEHQSAVTDGTLLLRLPRRDALLRVALRRTSLLGAHRFNGPVELRSGEEWRALGWEELARLVEAELELRTGHTNEEFLDQVRSSHEGIRAALLAAADEPGDAFRASEQSLLFGHRFHPTPKARSGAATDRAAYAPETSADFALQLLAVRDDLVVEEHTDPRDLASLDRLRPEACPAGYTVLPTHPWQWSLKRDLPQVRAALAAGDLLDLGKSPTTVWPTSSVRTVCDDNGFLKFSLNVRITNCLRKNAAYELSGAVALTRRLDPVAADLADRFPGTVLLREPAYRSARLGEGVEALEGLAVIVREGLGRALPGTRVLLAAAIADEHPTSSAQVSRLLPDVSPDTLLAWWAAYLRLLVPPVIAAWADHGVVFEPHLQNVLVAVDGHGMPVQVLLRDLEGTKLVPDHAPNAEFLAGLPEQVARPMTYDAQRGWDRVVYCLVVNHLAEVLAVLADLAPELEARLWREVRTVLGECADRHPDDPRLRALLAGVPLPAKSNLFTRWERLADREAVYVRLTSPLGADFLAGVSATEDAR